MSHGHSHGGVAVQPPRASEKTQTILAIAVAVVAIATALGAARVWPQDFSYRGALPTAPEDARWVIAEIVSGPVEGPDGNEYGAIIPAEPEVGELVLIETWDYTQAPGVGDRIRALAFEDGTLFFSDFDRASPMVLLLIVYIALVLAVAWWRGIGALLGLALAFGIVVFFTVPALFDGSNPMVVGLVTGSGALFVLLYLAHGVNARTTTAYLGTLAGLAITAAIGWWAVTASHLNGVWLETGVHLELAGRGVSLPGLVLCGIILAGLGILNDVTVTQASAVWELRAARPDISRRDLFWRGMRIGRDHIASTVYTIAFAYVGAALPAILILSLYDQSTAATLTSADIAEEIVRTLAGSIGLVLAVPLTTAIGAAVVGRDAIAAPKPSAPAPPAAAPAATQAPPAPPAAPGRPPAPPSAL